MKTNADYQYLYIGSYTSNDAPGCEPNEECGAGIYFFNRQEDGLWNWSISENEKEMGRDIFPAYNPSYMELDRTRQYLYAVEEVAEHGAILSYEIQENGKLEFLERYYFRGGASCHITVTRDNQYLVVSDYTGGLITIFERMENGTLRFVKQSQSEMFVLPENTDKDVQRQTRPHAHSTIELMDGRILTADLGRDELIVTERMTSEIDGRELTIWHTGEPWKLPEGSGPRHMALHPNGKWLYVLTELSGEVAIFDTETGRQVGACSVKYRATGSEYSGEGIAEPHANNTSSDIHISEDGKCLYAANRGLDTIVIFSVSVETGALTLQSIFSSGGHGPRSFAITDEHIVIANQQSGNVVIYRINPGGNMGLLVGEVYVPKAAKVILL